MDRIQLSECWIDEGRRYTEDINKMFEKADRDGWESISDEPVDPRDRLASQVYRLLKKANAEGSVEAFRRDFPPAFLPLASIFEEFAVQEIVVVGDREVVFSVRVGPATYDSYLLKDGSLSKTKVAYAAFGRSKLGSVFAYLEPDLEHIVVLESFGGKEFNRFRAPQVKFDDDYFPQPKLIPFNDGSKVLVLSECYIHLVTQDACIQLLPVESAEDDEVYELSMGNCDLSHNNEWICVGSQDEDHRILDANGNYLGVIGAQSSYPHYALFSKDDHNLLSNTCHFYNGVSIAVDVTSPNGLEIEAYQEESDDFVVIDEVSRVYAGVAFDGGVIIGDAGGYIKAYDWSGKMLWRQFVGGNICSLGLSDDESVLWIGTYAGTFLQLTLGAGQDPFTIGNGDHREDFRYIFVKNDEVEGGYLKW